MSSTPSLIQLSDRPLSRLFAYLRPQRQRLWLACGSSFINKILDLAPPVLVGWAVDSVTNQAPLIVSGVVGADPWAIGLWLGGLGVAIFALESFFQWLFTLWFMQVAQRVQHDLRLDAYRRMQTREMGFFENHRVGETMSMLSDDVNQLERFLNTVFNDIVQLISLFIIAAVILLMASPALTLVAILPIPIVVWGSLAFQKLLTPRYRRVREAVAGLNTRLENNLGGITVIKSFTAEKFEAGRMEEVSAEYRDRNEHAIRLSAMFVPLIRMGVSIGFGMVLVLGAVWTFDGSITVGTFTLFTMMVQRILWPLTGLGRILDETERCRASAARIFGLLDTPARIVDPVEAQPMPNSGEVEFDQVKFQYDQGPEILKGLSLKIPAGQTVGIAGTTGAGKSTVIKLLLRLYDPTSGVVRVGGTDAKCIKLTDLRQQVALVSQDVYLFQGTIAENIAYGQDQLDLVAVRKAAEKARLLDFVESLPEGFDTLVGERGIKLSGGQRQRLSIARALLKNAPILILDEATSSVDTETERDIQTSLDEFARGRTAIVIAHRLSTIRNADRIVVLQDGQVTDEGTHDELTQRSGVYRDLWALQSGMGTASH